MKSVINLATVLLFCGVLLDSHSGFAQKVTVDSVQVAIQPRENGEFQLHVEFALPSFGSSTNKINIDYAVLTIALEVKKARVEALNLLEVFVADENKNAPLLRLAYNSNPVTGRVRAKQAGSELLEIDLTQIVGEWMNKGVVNNGVLLVSHARMATKILTQDMIALAGNTKPVVTIFYTLME